MTFFVSWARSCQNERKPKNNESSSLLKVFLTLGALSEAMLAHLGALLGHLGAILEQLGDKMWPESGKMSRNIKQERQDEARWRKWAARERNWEPQGGRDPRNDTRVVGGGAPLEVSRLGTPDSDFSWNWRLLTPAGSQDSDCKRNWMTG